MDIPRPKEIGSDAFFLGYHLIANFGDDIRYQLSNFRTKHSNGKSLTTTSEIKYNSTKTNFNLNEDSFDLVVSFIPENSSYIIVK